jgi:oxygen-dependent protoporphyrinogen oxidase
VAVGSKLLTGGPVETYPFRLPLSVRERAAFAAAGLKVQRAVARYHREAAGRPREEPAEIRARVLAYEGHRTFKELLGDLPPAVEAIFSCAAHRATAELDELSAGCGISLFALVWGGKGSLIARNLVGGAGQLPAALGDELGARARTSCRVTEIREDAGQLVVEHTGDGGAGRLRAAQVIVAVPAPHAASLVAAVARQAAAALEQLTYGPFLSVAIQTLETAAVPWDDVYAMGTPGRVFDMFTNQGQALRSAGTRLPGGSLMLFAGAHGAAALMRESDEVVIERFLSDLHGLYPQTRGIVGEARVHRWELGNVYARPGRARLQAPLEGAHGAHGNLHLAGDYFAELGNMEAAARTGALAADRVDALLRHGSRPAVGAAT